MKSPKQTDSDDPRWAKAIAARRLELGKTQERMVADSGDTLTQTDASRIGRGLIHPVSGLPITKFFGLLRALEWTVEQFTEATGLEVPFVSESQAEALAAARHLEVHPTYIQFPVFHCAAAGDEDAPPIDGEVAMISAEKLRARGADPRDVRVYRVNGDCMISTEARLIEKNIAHGDYVAVDTRRSPQPGDVVAAWWPDDHKLVIKRYRVEREGIILYPASPGHVSLVLPHEEDVNVIGVVIWREG